MEDKIFDIIVEAEGRRYKGWVNPSEKVNAKGIPQSFHVVLDNVSFGYLSFQDCKWTVDEHRPAALVNAVGKQIEAHFQF